MEQAFFIKSTVFKSPQNCDNCSCDKKKDCCKKYKKKGVHCKKCPKI